VKYTQEQRLDIAKRIYNREMSVKEAIQQYGICKSALEGYMRRYREREGLPVRVGSQKVCSDSVIRRSSEAADMEVYNAMSREELIGELVMSKINEARLKKGYMVKGEGANKEYILLDSKNTK